MLPASITLLAAAVVILLHPSPARAEGQNPIEPIHSIALKEAVPNGRFTNTTAILATAASPHGIFLLCASSDSDRRFLLRLDVTGAVQNVWDLPYPVLPALAASEDGSVIAVRDLGQGERQLETLGPAALGTPPSIPTGQLHALMRVLTIQGRLMGVFPDRIADLLTPSRKTPLSLLDISSRLIVPLSGDRFAFVNKPAAAIATLDLASGSVGPETLLLSEAIKNRSAVPASLVDSNGDAAVIRNTVHTAALTNNGTLLLGLSGYPVAQAVALEVLMNGRVQAVHRFHMPMWQDLRSQFNFRGAMHGHELLVASDCAVWVDKAHGRLAFYRLPS